MNEYRQLVATMTSLLAQARGELNAGETAKAHELLKHALACAAQILPEDIFLAAARHGQALATRPPQPEPEFLAALDDSCPLLPPHLRGAWGTDNDAEFMEHLGATFVHIQAAEWEYASPTVNAAKKEMTAARELLPPHLHEAWLRGAARAQNQIHAQKQKENEKWTQKNPSSSPS